MSKRTLTHYTADFRASSAKLAITSDQAISQTARDLGVNETTLYGWVSHYHPNYNKRSGHSVKSSEAEELRQLRKENSRLKQQRDILKKAAAYFASEM